MQNDVIIDNIMKAVSAHSKWKTRLHTGIQIGEIDTPSVQITRDDQCEFGQWLHGTQIDEETKRGKPYKVIKRLHAEFHGCAGKIAHRVEQGEIDAAQELLEGDYRETSRKLMLALTLWRTELSS